MDSGRNLRVVKSDSPVRIHTGEPENLPERFAHRAVGMKASEIRSLFARIRGRARPEGINVNKLAPVTMVVFIVLAALTVLLLAADIVNPVQLNL